MCFFEEFKLCFVNLGFYRVVWPPTAFTSGMKPLFPWIVFPATNFCVENVAEPFSSYNTPMCNHKACDHIDNIVSTNKHKHNPLVNKYEQDDIAH